MACHLAGVPTAVATSGTSFGEGHITILRRLLMDDSQLRGEVIFTFDGDAAGRRAALRAFGMEEKFVTQTFVAVQPDGMDPCDLRLKEGDAAVRDLVASRVPLFEFAVRSVLGDHDLESAEGRMAALDAAAPIVAKIKDRGLRKVYAGNLDRWLGLMDQELVIGRINDHIAGGSRTGAGRNSRAERGASERAGRPRPGRAGRRRCPVRRRCCWPSGRAARARARAGQPGYDTRDPVINLERQVLKLAIQRPALFGPAFDALGADAFTANAHRGGPRADRRLRRCRAGWPGA